MTSQSFFRMTRRLVALTLLFALPAVHALAQSVSARIEGAVTDASGATVPGATVTATQTETNFSKVRVTDGEGTFTLTALPLGPYRVQVDLTGFRPTATTVTLHVNEVARLDFKLDIGAQSEVVEVTGSAPVIDKSTSSIGTVINRAQVENLPLNGRNFTQLATLSPGVTRGTPGSIASGASGNAETFRYGEAGGGSISVNGLREQFNSFLLDGIDNNETLVNTLIFFPAVEALQEFRVITTNAPAEFGRAGGAITNLVTKSGTNQLHGSLYEFNRAKGLAATPTFATEKPDFRRNQFGATLGGPLVKDKTFFFLSYSGLRSTLPVEAGGKVSVPTARMRSGDFSELLNPSFTGIGRAIIVNDPLTNRPFPGNVIPANRLDPVAVKYLSTFPLPDVPGAGAQYNYFTHRERDQRFHDADARFDHDFSPSDTAFLRMSYANDRQFDPGRIPGFHAGFGSGTAQAKGIGAALGETHTFSGSVSNEARVGFYNYRYEFLPVAFGEDQNRALGIPGPGGLTVDNGISLIGGGNGSFIEYLGDFGQYIVRQKTMQVSDAVTILAGSHAFKVGAVAIRRNLEFERSQFGKGFYFFPDATEPSAGRTGYEVAEMLVGRTQFTATGTPGFVPRTTISWENSAFVQDDWRVSRKLTLNLGLRYDVFTPYYEADDKLANYDPATNRIVLPGQNGAPRSTVNTDKNNFGPRVGFAYEVGAKTVVSGAYGIFYSLDRGGIDNQLSENPPANVVQFRFDGPGSTVRLSEPIPLPIAVSPNSPDLPAGSGLVYVPRDTETTMVQQFNIGVQHEILDKTALLLAYVGTRGENLTAITSRAGFDGGLAGRLTTVANIGTSSYNSLQASLRRSSDHGLTYLASYTFGQARNDSPGPFPGNGSAFRNTPTDARNLGLDEGYADYDVRHRFTLAATYELPFLKDNRFLGGWSTNAILTLSTGTPFSVFAGDNRAFASGDPNDGPRTSAQWFDTSAFSATGTGQRSERNIVRAPGIRTLDMSLFKTFKLTGRGNLELRIEGFNVTNTPQYDFPNQFVGDGNFGKITGTRLNTERQVQLAARLLF